MRLKVRLIFHTVDYACFWPGGSLQVRGPTIRKPLRPQWLYKSKLSGLILAELVKPSEWARCVPTAIRRCSTRLTTTTFTDHHSRCSIRIITFRLTWPRKCSTGWGNRRFHTLSLFYPNKTQQFQSRSRKNSSAHLVWIRSLPRTHERKSARMTSEPRRRLRKWNETPSY